MKKYYYNINISIPNDARNVTINLNLNKNDLNTNEKHEEIDLNNFDKYGYVLLGDHVTEEQLASIADGSFNRLPLGAYWTINDVNYRIMAHDQFYGYNGITRHHVVVMPDTIFSLQQYNGSKNNNIGGYNSSSLKTYIENIYNNMITNIFRDHILSHTHDLSSGIHTGGTLAPTDNTKAWLINSYNVNGSKYEYETTYNWQEADKVQFPAFKNDTTLKISNYDGHTYYWWLGSSGSDSSSYFCFVTSSGMMDGYGANGSRGVRPAFLVY